VRPPSWWPVVAGGLAVAAGALASPAGVAHAATAERAALESRLAGIAAQIGGQAGVAGRLVETGDSVALHGADRFPMASVYKFPLALAVLNRVDRGELRLADSVGLAAHDYRPGRSLLEPPGGGQVRFVRVERLLELAVGESDNTACDALMRLVGGPAGVARRLRELGVAGIDVSRYEAQLGADWGGVDALPPEPQWTLARFDSLFAAVPAERRRAAARAYEKDPRDTATPVAMVRLLTLFHQGWALSPASTAALRGWMEQTGTGPMRLKGHLPAGTVVAHKTGTMGTVVNDVGVITLPGGRGHLALAVFLKGSPAPSSRCEWAIAEMARATYDYFAALLPTTPPATTPPPQPPTGSSPR
jgi:beta-lactamase class A